MAKFSLITACRNSRAYVEETVASVLSQSAFRSGRHELEYVVRDGGSTDGSVEILRRFEKDGVKVISEPDAGFYDALAKGLQQATGDYVAYLNAGDYLHPHGLSVAADCFDLGGVDWLTGYAVTYNERSQATRAGLPFRFRRRLFECAAYGTLLPALQQESTVWRRSLHSSVDFEFLKRLRYAGDAYLWKCFAAACEPSVVRGQIGGFRIHRGQISGALEDYRRELASFCRAPSSGDRLQCAFDRFLWAMPERVRGLLAGDSSLILYDHAAQGWRATPYRDAYRYR
jgi:glycosyltransferase involved in cell wall biosynthesis